MEYKSSIEVKKRQPLDLGYVVCKWCGVVITTIPTNGVKRIYGECPAKSCLEVTLEGRTNG